LKESLNIDEEVNRMKRILKKGALLADLSCVLAFWFFISTAVIAQEGKANTNAPTEKRQEKSASIYQIPWSVISTGGVMTTNGSTLRVSATARQTAIGKAEDSNRRLYSGFWNPSGLVTAVEEGKEPFLPNAYELRQNYPNPFNPSTTIDYTLPRTSRVTLVIYNIRGEQVRMLVDDIQTAGYKTANWDGRDNWGKEVSSGLYLYQIIAEPLQDTSIARAVMFTQSNKMLLLK
jgi:hypothetical protein